MNNKKRLLAVLASCTWVVAAHGNTLTIVGTGNLPARAPAPGGDWTMKSYCVDINDRGQAACRTLAVSDGYSCNAFNMVCHDTVSTTHLWDGQELLPVSNGEYDEPRVINESGEIAGGWANGARQTSAAIWRQGLPVELLQSGQVILDMDDQGNYIMAPGYGYHSTDNTWGGYSFSDLNVDESTLVYADGRIPDLAGPVAIPLVLNDSGEVVGKQVLQQYQFPWNTPTGDETPEVSGVGWLYDNSEADALPRNEEGLLDRKSGDLFPTYFLRSSGTDTTFNWVGKTLVTDLNEMGDFLVIHATDTGSFYNRYRMASYYCSMQAYTDPVYGKTYPFRCDRLLSQVNGFSAKGHMALGMNDLGDVVGFQLWSSTPQQAHEKIPYVWLRNQSNRLVGYRVDDLMPPDSGYRFLEANGINNRRQLVGTCLSASGSTVGCILNVANPAIPLNLRKPQIELLNPVAGDVSGTVTIEAHAFDRDGWIEKVVFIVDNTFLGKVSEPPYVIDWDSSTVSAGAHVIKAIATDNDGNKRFTRVDVNVVTTPGPQPGGDQVVESDGTITAVGADYVEVSDGNRVYHDGNTRLTFNDVPGFATGLPIQYKAVPQADGRLLATVMEVN